jgi:hypothetical protein
MKLIFILLLLLLAFLAGVFASPKIAAMNWTSIDWRETGKAFDYWASRYQTFLGVLVAIMVAYLTVSEMGRQNAISERQFLSGQMQSLITDRANLQFVISQIKELRFQRRLFENNIAFLDTEAEKLSGWQNGSNLTRTAFTNVESFRNLVSANTAKFLGLTSARTELISKLDAIVDSQDKMQEAFLNWANLNRQANADPAAPAPPQRAAYFQTKATVLAKFDELAPTAEKAAAELVKKMDQTEKDVVELQKTIDRKVLE